MKTKLSPPTVSVYGMRQFCCIVNGSLRSFRTDRRGSDAVKAARAYFASLKS